VTLRLPLAVRPLFEDWLGRHFPTRKEKVLNRIRALRGGKINDPNFGTRMTGEGIFAEQIEKIFEVACRKAGILSRRAPLSASNFRPAGGVQLSLF
jgi:DNA repair photolyase